MRLQIGWLAVVMVGLLIAAGDTQACGGYGLSGEVLRAIADDPDRPLPVEKLREQGPAALDELLKLREQLVAHRDGPKSRRLTADEEKAQIESLQRRIARLDELIDQVGMQRYCSRSRLFWHTDLEKAKEVARTSGKPILSLRMLGNLNEDFSCANSRFFRTTLYANEEISKALRENYVLHWQSMRPVPRVTIDFGDGRKLERTLTGNSAHYILNSEGEVLEALPGLYGPKAFLRKINEGAELAKWVAQMTPTERAEALTKYHAQQFAALGEQFARDMGEVAAAVERLARLGELKGAAESSPLPPRNAEFRRAVDATEIAQPKSRVESRLIASALPAVAAPDTVQDEATWRAIAALHAADAELDDASRELIRSENPTAAAAGRIAITKMVVEDPMLRLVRTLQNSIALDTVRNEYQLHRRIHEWLADASYRPAVDVLNERVYGELFLTPSSDTWLGLAPPEVYTALPNGGVARAAK